MADAKQGHLSALQPIPKNDKMGKKIFPDSERPTDNITHEGFEKRIFMRRHEVDFPDHFQPSVMQPIAIEKKSPEKQVSSGKMKVSSKNFCYYPLCS